MKNKSLIKILILPALVLAGFFVLTRQAQAVYSTTTWPVGRCQWHPGPTEDFTENEYFWFDGENFRFTFTPIKDFCTAWEHQVTKIQRLNVGQLLSTVHQFFQGGGGNTGAAFLDDFNDLNDYQADDRVFFIWEQGEEYNTYLTYDYTSPTGVIDFNKLFYNYIHEQPGNYLLPHSRICLKQYFTDCVYIDYDYNAEPDPVILIPGILGSWLIRGAWFIDPIFHTYDNLMEALIAAGYKEHWSYGNERNLFTFPYNWREDNWQTAELLKAKIQEVKEITGKNQVDLIAHSMGGLVARAYIESNDYQSDVDQLIFLGTPHLGAPASYLTYEGGEFAGERNWLFKKIFQMEALSHSYLDLVDYVREQVPTVSQLLPIYNYLKDKDGDDWILRSYPNNYPENDFLAVLNETPNLDLLKNRVRVTNVVGNLGEDSTLNFIRATNDPNPDDNKWVNGYPENLTTTQSGLEKGDGDGTVPYSSANSLEGVEVIETIDSGHGALPTTMQKEVIETLTGQRPEDYYNNKVLYAITRWTLFRVYSPVDFMVTDPWGRKVGKDFISQAEINEIPNAFYSGFDTETEFVLIPEPIDGQYQVALEGTESGGEYTLAVSFIDENNLSQSQELFADSFILPDAVDGFEINFNAYKSSQTTIESEVDFNKLIELANQLFSRQEIKRIFVKNLLVSAFERLNNKYQEMLNAQHEWQRQMFKRQLNLGLGLILRSLNVYQFRGWLTNAAKDVLSANINLLINKLN